MRTAGDDVRCLYPFTKKLKATCLVSDDIIVLANVRVCVGADLGSAIQVLAIFLYVPAEEIGKMFF